MVSGQWSVVSGGLSRFSSGEIGTVFFGNVSGGLFNMGEKQSQLAFDYAKHLTTLDTASVILMAGLFERIFACPVNKNLIVIMFACFLMSLLASLLVMGIVLVSQSPTLTNSSKSHITMRWVMGSLLVAVLLFFAGLAIAGESIAEQRFSDKKTHYQEGVTSCQTDLRSR